MHAVSGRYFERKVMLELLILALIMVESGGDTSAVGDGKKAVGVLQIHPIMVRDVNRILGEDKFSLDDRYDRQKSIAMCEVYFNHYGDGKTVEQLAAMWCSGPKGWQKLKTNKKVQEYVRKVNLVLDRLKEVE